jgi:hypothetical protein
LFLGKAAHLALRLVELTTADCVLLVNVVIKSVVQPSDAGFKAAHNSVLHAGQEERALMYWMVLDTLGFTTFSSALTRRFVVLMAASSVKKADCRLARFTSSSTVLVYAVLHTLGPPSDATA